MYLLEVPNPNSERQHALTSDIKLHPRGGHGCCHATLALSLQCRPADIARYAFLSEQLFSNSISLKYAIKDIFILRTGAHKKRRVAANQLL